MKICLKCGCRMEKEDSYCPNCGEAYSRDQLGTSTTWIKILWVTAIVLIIGYCFARGATIEDVLKFALHVFLGWLNYFTPYTVYFNY